MLQGVVALWSELPYRHIELSMGKGLFISLYKLPKHYLFAERECPVCLAWNDDVLFNKVWGFCCKLDLMVCKHYYAIGVSYLNVLYEPNRSDIGHNTSSLYGLIWALNCLRYAFILVEWNAHCSLWFGSSSCASHVLSLQFFFCDPLRNGRSKLKSFLITQVPF